MIKIFVVVFLFLLVGCANNDIETGCKGEFCCSSDSDCNYYWFAGGCYTQAFIDHVNSKCQDGSGPCPSAAVPRENVTCTCENNACITHG